MAHEMEYTRRFVTEMTKHFECIDKQRPTQTLMLNVATALNFPAHGNDDKLIECVRQVSLQQTFSEKILMNE